MSNQQAKQTKTKPSINKTSTQNPNTKETLQQNHKKAINTINTKQIIKQTTNLLRPQSNQPINKPNHNRKQQNKTNNI